MPQRGKQRLGFRNPLDIQIGEKRSGAKSGAMAQSSDFGARLIAPESELPTQRFSTLWPPRPSRRQPNES